MRPAGLQFGRSCGRRGNRAAHPAGAGAVRPRRRPLRLVRCDAQAALAGAAKVASQITSGTIVFIVCDGGWKYLSTGAYTDDLDVAEAAAEQIIYF